MECGVPTNCIVLTLPHESYNILIQEGTLCPHKEEETGPREPNFSSKETGRRYHRDSCVSGYPDMLVTVSRYELSRSKEGTTERDKGGTCATYNIYMKSYGDKFLKRLKATNGIETETAPTSQDSARAHRNPKRTEETLVSMGILCC